MFFDQGFQLVNNLGVFNDILISFLAILAVFLGVSIIFWCVFGQFQSFQFLPRPKGLGLNVVGAVVMGGREVYSLSLDLYCHLPWKCSCVVGSGGRG